MHFRNHECHYINLLEGIVNFQKAMTHDYQRQFYQSCNFVKVSENFHCLFIILILINNDLFLLCNPQGFIHVPKKPGGLKPELIDVDLVIGMLQYTPV